METNEQMTTETPKLTAAQRLENLEKSIEKFEKLAQVLDGAIFNVANAVNRLSDEHSDLEAKVLSLVKILESGNSVTTAAVETQVVSDREKMLKSALEAKVAEGKLAPTEIIGHNSFLVGRELDTATQNVNNPRVQVAIFAMNEDMKAKLLGKKAGDSVDVNGEVTLVIEEVYEIKEELEELQQNQA